MFRHTTKQNVRSQNRLRKNAADALERDRQILYNTVYNNTYYTQLPEKSKRMLDNVVVPLIGCNSEVGGEARLIYTLALFDHSKRLRVRACFIQPEVSSATATMSSLYSGLVNSSRSEVTAELNNPSPGRISASKGKCQVAERISLYVVKKSGLDCTAQWSYFNVSKIRIFYVVSSRTGVELMSMIRETISIYQSFCVKGCVMVYASEMRYFKVTVSPEDSETTENPNKFTCIFLYCDGTFKILRTPHKSYRVCSLLRDTILRAHSSHMCSTIVFSLAILEESGSQRKS